MKEQWKKIEEWDVLVSDRGNLRSTVNGKRLVKNKRNGRNIYKFVDRRLQPNSKKSKAYSEYVDRLVWKAFGQDDTHIQEDRHCLIHLDHDDFNDRIENLALMNHHRKFEMIRIRKGRYGCIDDLKYDFKHDQEYQKERDAGCPRYRLRIKGAVLSEFTDDLQSLIEWRDLILAEEDPEYSAFIHANEHIYEERLRKKK